MIKEKLNLDIEERINEIKSFTYRRKKEFDQVCKKLKLTKKEIIIFQIIADLGYYKWSREYEFLHALYKLKPVQNEIGKRHGLNSLESMYILNEEYKNKKINFKEAARKRMSSFMAIAKKNKETTFLYGGTARKKYQSLDLVDKKPDNKAKRIKGVPAQPGKAVGKAKIINTSKEIKKMKKGDILVSVATAPAILLAIKKASAIITDEGGITCHAAIVAREMKIPCVIGTKIATKVLKDGDKVEVDAYKGIVKKL